MKTVKLLFATGLIIAGVFLPVSLHAAEATDRSNSPPNVLDGRKLVHALRSGGHVIYFRHGITDLSTEDRDRSDLGNCATQRRLSELGRQQMSDIGRVIQKLDIRVSSVLSSPYCRSIDTGKLAFGMASINNDLANTVTADEATAKRQARALQKLLATVPAAGANTVLSGHTGNLQEATGIWPSPEGVAIIFKPDGAGSFRFVARVPPTHWEKLLRGAKPVTGKQP